MLIYFLFKIFVGLLVHTVIQDGLFCEYWQLVFQKMANIWHKQYIVFWKTMFKTIFAKFGTIWQVGDGESSRIVGL